MLVSGSFLRALLLAVPAFMLAACDRVTFGWLNRGLDGPTRSVSYDEARQLQLDVFEPASSPQGLTPVVVFFYGGAWRNGERAQYRFVGARLAARGVLTFVVDYRKYPNATFPGFIEDAARAVAWVHAHARSLGGDPDRVFVMGHSAGAQIAALLATERRWLDPHGLAPCRLVGAIGLSGPYRFDVDDELAPIFPDSAEWRDAMPLELVDGDEPPFLLIHGDADQRVDPRNSPRMAEALRAQGVAATLEMMPGGKHRTPLAGLYRPDRYPDILPMIERFVRDTASADCRVTIAP